MEVRKTWTEFQLNHVSSEANDMRTTLKTKRMRWVKFSKSMEGHVFLGKHTRTSSQRSCQVLYTMLLWKLHEGINMAFSVLPQDDFFCRINSRKDISHVSGVYPHRPLALYLIIDAHDVNQLGKLPVWESGIQTNPNQEHLMALTEPAM